MNQDVLGVRFVVRKQAEESRPHQIPTSNADLYMAYRPHQPRLGGMPLTSLLSLLYKLRMCHHYKTHLVVNHRVLSAFSVSI